MSKDAGRPSASVQEATRWVPSASSAPIVSTRPSRSTESSAVSQTWGSRMGPGSVMMPWPPVRPVDSSAQEVSASPITSMSE